MNAVMPILQLVGGRADLADTPGPAGRLRLALLGLAVTAAAAALYGAAVGSTDVWLALGNLWKFPAVIVLSALCAVPAGLLAAQLSGSRLGSADLALSVVSGNAIAGLTLAVLAPVVALYGHTSHDLGTPLAMGAAALATVVGLWAFVRALVRLAPEGGALTRVPAILTMVVQLACLLQMLGLFAPLLPEATVFSGGADGLLGR